MDDDRIPKQSVFWEMNATCRGSERLRKNWKDVICHDLESIRVPWEDATHFTVDRDASHDCGPLCL